MLFLLMALAQSCSKGTHYFLFNSSQETVDVSFGNFKTTLAAGHRERITDWQNNQGPLVVNSAKQRWTYAVTFDFFGRLIVDDRKIELPFKEYAHPAFSTDDYWFQIEVDGSVCPIPKEKSPGGKEVNTDPYCIHPKTA